MAKPADPDPRWTRAWIAWIGAFFLIEGSALARRQPQNTLSDMVWRVFDIPQHLPPSRETRMRRLALLGFVAWLSAHFLSGDEI